MTSWMQMCSHHTCGYLCTNKKPLQPVVVSPSKHLNRRCLSWYMQLRKFLSRTEGTLVSLCDLSTCKDTSRGDASTSSTHIPVLCILMAPTLTWLSSIILRPWFKYITMIYTHRLLILQGRIISSQRLFKT